LRRFVEEGADSEKAYMLLVQIPSNGQIEGEQIAVVRLIPNYPFMRFTGRVRESLFSCLNQMSMEIAGLEQRIQRDVSEHDADRKRRIAERNLRIADIEIAEYGPSPRMYNCLGDAFQVLERPKQSIEAYQKSLELAEIGGTDMLESFYGLLTVMETLPNSLEQQIDLCLKSLEHYPLDAQLLCAMGGYLQRQGRLDLAARSYETAFRFGHVRPHVWHVGVIKEIAAVCCGLALQLEKKDELALGVLQQGVTENPDSERIRRQLLGLYIKQGLREEALWQLEQLPERPEPIEAMRSAVRGACLASQENWAPATAYLRTAYEGGCHDVLCLRWLTVTLLNQQLTGEAADVIQAWREIDPYDAEMIRYGELLSGRAEAGEQAGPADELSMPENTRVDRRVGETAPKKPTTIRPTIPAPPEDA
jgi:tetratricopeptide (TPR) repeat protein